MPKIRILQKNLELNVPVGANLMQLLLQNKIPVASSCLGDGICGKCRMTVAGAVAEPLDIEIQTRLRNQISTDQRLCCQISVENDLTVTTTYW